MVPLFGIETEYGCAWLPSGSQRAASGHAARAIVDAVPKLLPCLRDASGAGVFLPNGSRVYVDGSHVEAATCEVTNPWDLARYLFACHRVLERAAERVKEESGRQILLFRTNVDHEARTSWGCHESILCSRATTSITAQLAPHLVSRIVYTGAGGFNPLVRGLEFVLSPRSLFMSALESHSSTADRGLVQLKDEPCAVGAYRRLHLLCGESLCSMRATWLRAATTVIVVAMIDAGMAPGDGVYLANPLDALYRLTGDPSCRARLRLAAGGSMTAAQVQRHYLRLAESHCGASFMPSWTEDACREWRKVLDEIEQQAPSLGVSLDWAIKRAIFERLLARHDLGWHDLPRMTTTRESGVHRRPLLSRQRVRSEVLECDIRFGQLGSGGLFPALERERVLAHEVQGVGAIEQAVEHPPAAGRAHVRGLAVRRLAASHADFVCDWTSIQAPRADELIDLGHPYETQERWRRKVKPTQAVRPARRGGPAPAGVDDQPQILRARALDRFIQADYEGAEQLLIRLVASGYELPGTCCHLARAALASGNVERARVYVTRAWSLFGTAPRYVKGRVLWLKLALAILDGDGEQAWLERIADLALTCQDVRPWVMEPVMRRLSRNLPPPQVEMLSALLDHMQNARPVAIRDRRQRRLRLDALLSWTRARWLAVIFARDVLLGGASGLLMWVAAGAVCMLANWLLGSRPAGVFSLVCGVVVAATSAVAAERLYHASPRCLSLGRLAFATGVVFNGAVVDCTVPWVAAAARALALLALVGCVVLGTRAARSALRVNESDGE